MDPLSECRHPIADAIFEYRKWQKLKEDVVSCIHGIRPDGRIHGEFDPLGTDTGQFSSSEPNMQDITRGDLRTPFVASVGNVLVIANYSQIELNTYAVVLSGRVTGRCQQRQGCGSGYYFGMPDLPLLPSEIPLAIPKLWLMLHERFLPYLYKK
jgi:hypothetical protein